MKFSRRVRLTTAKAILWRAGSLLVLAGLLISGCALPSFNAKGEPTSSEVEVLQPTETNSSVTPASFPTATPFSDSSKPFDFTELTPEDFTGADAKTLNGLILFTSPAPDPFTRFDLRTDPIQPGRYLFAISPDGKLAGRISTDGSGSALSLPVDGQGKVRIIGGGEDAAHEAIEQITLPEECRAWDSETCSNFTFGPEGRSLAYYTGPESCGRSLLLQDLVLNQTINTWSNVHWFSFFQDGSLVLSLDDCSGDPRQVYLYIPNNDRQAGLGQEGEMYWDPSHQAVLIKVQGEPAVQSGLWGYNLATSRVFLWMEKKQIIDDTPIWLPDGLHFVYQHRAIHYDENSGTATLDGPRQIILMNAWSRDQRLLAYDGKYDYHLCLSSGEPCELRYGDWLKIRRTLFQPARFPADEVDDLPEARCALFGLDCQEPAEEMALNWKTGEMLPWAEVDLVEQDSPSAFPPPDLTRLPVYNDPSGDFSLYTDQGGRTLWYVPASGDPILWVRDSENFVYLP